MTKEWCSTTGAQHSQNRADFFSMLLKWDAVTERITMQYIVIYYSCFSLRLHRQENRMKVTFPALTARNTLPEARYY